MKDKNDLMMKPIGIDNRHPGLGAEIALFARSIDSLGTVGTVLVDAIKQLDEAARKQVATFETKNCEVSYEGNVRTVKIHGKDQQTWNKLRGRRDDYALSQRLLPRSLVVSLVSQFDAYLSRLLRYIYIAKPETFQASEKQITFADLNRFDSLDAVREYMLEKEIESVLRESKLKQFKYCEDAFAVPLRKGLDCWPAFVEIAERRNLFVHTDGCVSTQYISTCRSQGVAIGEGIKPGSELGATREYLHVAHEIVFEVGVKLGHVLWRKLLPAERSAADKSLNFLVLELLEREQWRRAIQLLDFAATDIKKFSDEETRLILTVNRAQAYLWSGDASKTREIMGEVDWSVTSDNFRLADAVLAEDWNSAVRAMKRMGKDGAVEQHHYHEWPLFRVWRKEKSFATAYEQIFGEEFAKTEQRRKRERKPKPPADPPTRANSSRSRARRRSAR